MPKHVALMAGDDEATHLRAVGYRIVSDEGEPMQLEGTDDFVTRMQVMIDLTRLVVLGWGIGLGRLRLCHSPTSYDMPRTRLLD